MFVDAQGIRIAPHVLFQNLVDPFERCGAVVGGHGLVLLQPHSLPPLVVRSNIADTINLSFDTVQAWTRHYLVQPHVWVLAAGCATLFTRNSVAFPSDNPFV